MLQDDQVQLSGETSVIGRSFVVSTVFPLLAHADLEQQGFSHRQGGVRCFDARVKILMRGVKFNMMANSEHQKDGPVHSCHHIKMLTPRHLCENPKCRIPEARVRRD